MYEKITHIRQTMLVVTVLLLIVAILTAFWLSAGITKPLSVMGKAMKHVQRGEFNQALHVMPKVREGHSEVELCDGCFRADDASAAIFDRDGVRDEFTQEKCRI